MGAVSCQRFGSKERRRQGEESSSEGRETLLPVEEVDRRRCTGKSKEVVGGRNEEKEGNDPEGTVALRQVAACF